MERSYIEEFRGSKTVEGFCSSSFTGIVEFRNKDFSLDLKLFFIIVDCFLGRFPPGFFIVKLVYIIGFLFFEGWVV